MKNKEIISVAMTTYNGERFLREQLDSLYNQTRVPDEVVVCDDRSTDGTVAILEEYKQRFGLKYYINEASLGINNNFFRAISLCSGDYIALCDQDDIWLPKKIQRSFEVMRELEVSYPDSLLSVYSVQKDINAQGDVIGKKDLKWDSWTYKETFVDGYFQGCATFMNRALAEKALSDYYTYNDILGKYMYDVVISFICATLGVKYNLNEHLMLYRRHDNNVSGKLITKKDSIKNIVRHSWRYDRFIPDKRIEAICNCLHLYGSNCLNKDALCFMHKIQKINDSKNLCQGLCIILTLKEISLREKVIIVVRSLCMNFLKKIL